MADRSDVSQGIPLVGADDAATSVSQAVPLVGADDASTAVSQSVPLVAADDARAFISQFVLLVGRGPQVIPPDESPTGTFTVGAGLGLTWFLALQLSDSGEERRDKVVKSFRATGKFTNALLKGYVYGPTEDINVENIEDGIGQKVVVALTDTTQVQQTKRFQVNLPNAMMHTARIEGEWDGEGLPDRVDEIIYEVSRQGIRR